MPSGLPGTLPGTGLDESRLQMRMTRITLNRMEALQPSPPALPCTLVADARPGSMAGPGAPPHWHSRQLFGPHAEVTITHGEATYRLRITSLGKLILTK
jgi:hemin uptake protein HemP